MITISKNKKQKGFSILAVILVIVAVIVAIGIWALSGQSNTNNTSSSSSDIVAASIINDSGAIKLAYDNLILNGATASSIVFVPNTASTSTAPNILDPATGIQVPKVNQKAIVSSPTSTQGYWVYNPSNFKFPNIGINANADPVVIISGINGSVCQSINKILNGTTTAPNSGLMVSSFSTNGATQSAPTTAYPVDITGVTAASGWMAGCLGTAFTTDDNIFFRVLKAN